MVYRSVILFARFLSAGPGILLVIVIAFKGGASNLSLSLGIPAVLIPGFIRVFSGLKLCLKGNSVKKPLGMVIAQISLSMALAALVCAVISFVGLGIQAPTPEFGNIISEGRQYLRHASWLVVYPGLALALSALSFFILGESLNASLLSGESEENNANQQKPVYQQQYQHPQQYPYPQQNPGYQQQYPYPQQYTLEEQQGK